MATPIQDFLIQLGFKLDDPGYKRFRDTLVGTAKDFTNVAKTSTEAAIAIGLAVEKVASKYEDLYYLSQRTGATVQNLQAMAYGFSQIGLTAGEAKSVIDSFGMAMRNPGIAAALYGYGAIGRNEVEQHRNLIKNLSKLPDQFAFNIVSMYGETPLQYIQEKNNMPAEELAEKDRERRARAAGLDPDRLSKQSLIFMRDLRQLEDEFGLVGDKIAKDWMEPVDKVIKQIEWLVEEFLSFDNAVDGLATQIGSLLAVFGGIAGLKSLLSWMFGRGAAAVASGAEAAGAGLGWIGGIAGGITAGSLDWGEASGNKGMMGVIRSQMGTGGNVSQDIREAYIRQRALAYGINPDIAVRVARSEGLNVLADRQGGLGDQGTSGGDFQLHVGGGLGDLFRSKTGLDPLDMSNWMAADDFALKQAAKGGWSPFHGAARAGITPWEGIGAIGSEDKSSATRGIHIGAPNTTIHVTGNDNPHATAKAVASEQVGVWDDITRLYGTVR